MRFLEPLPVKARHVERSVIASRDDEPGQPPTDRLISLVAEAARIASSVDLGSVSRRMNGPPFYPDVWPGEHYKLLYGLTRSLRAERVVEVGTFQGLSALSIVEALPPGGSLLTFDIVPWQDIPSTALRTDDFTDGRLRQVIGDLSDRSVFEQFRPQLENCDFLFVDAPKNVVFEATILDYLETLQPAHELIVCFDDIRQWNMLAIWRSISRPKLDATSFGHWTGTGLIDWTAARGGSAVGGTRES